MGSVVTIGNTRSRLKDDEKRVLKDEPTREEENDGK